MGRKMYQLKPFRTDPDVTVSRQRHRKSHIFCMLKQVSTDLEGKEQTQNELQYMKDTMSEIKNTLSRIGLRKIRWENKALVNLRT